MVESLGMGESEEVGGSEGGVPNSIPSVNPRISALSPSLVLPQDPFPRTSWNNVLINWLQIHLLLQIFRPMLGIKPTNVHRSLHLELCQPAYKDHAFPQPNMYWTLCIPVDAQILNVGCFSLK